MFYISGGLLVSASHFGSLSIGTEINYLVARAKGRSSRAGQGELAKDQSVRANFFQYDLQHKFLDIILVDSSHHSLWKLKNNEGIFDGIITDRKN